MRPRSVASAALLLAPVAAFAAVPAALAQAPPNFTNVFTLPDPGVGEGVSWVDLDGDGDLDVTVSNEGQFLKLYRNDGGDVFTDASPPIFSVFGNYTGIAWADFDNDGDLDLLAAEAERPKHLFRNDGGGVWTDVAAPVLNNTSHVHGVAWADYDLDGDVDLFMAVAPLTNGTPGTCFLYRNNGDGTFTDVTTPTLADNQYGRGATWGDYDNDGDPDLFLATFGSDRLWRNDAGTFVDVSAPPVNNLNHGGGCEFGDYDNDADLDLYVANAFSGPGRLYRNNGDGSWTDVSAGGAQQGGRSIGPTWGDWDNDGDLDLFVAKFGDPKALLRNEGGGVFVNVTTVAMADTAGQGVGAEFADYDNDGDLDLYVANNGGTPDKLWRNDLANGNHWLELDLRGTVSNRSAIGARVSVLAVGLLQIREVSGGGGYNSQPTMRLHFGMGSAVVADKIHIRWPSGMIEETTMVALNQRLTLVEGTLPAAVPDRGRGETIRLTAAPNPSYGTTFIEFELARAGAVSLRVLDVTGRVVRVLERGERAASRHRVAWDGSDESGRRVAPGVYVARLEAAGRTIHVRMVRY